LEGLIFIAFLLAGLTLIVFYVVHRQKKLLATPETQLKIKSAQEFLSSVDEAKKEYFRNSIKEELKENYKALYKDLSLFYYKALQISTVNDFKRTFSQIDANGISKS
jgi:hypothetical protein